MPLSEPELLQAFQTIIDNLPSGVSLMDKDLRFVTWNEQLKHLLDFPDELFRPESPPDLYQLALFNAQRGEYGECCPEEQAREIVELANKRLPHAFERSRPDGTVLEIRGQPLPSGGFVTIYTDVTERQRAEQEVRRTASFLQAVLDNLPFGIVAVDREVRCRYWNRHSDMLFDLPPGSVNQGVPIEDLLRQIAQRGIYGPGDIEEHVARRMEVIGNFQAHSVELTRPDGRSLRVMGVPVLVDDKPEGMILLQEDITERKNHQATLENLAATDYLTGLMNRGAFLKAAEREIHRARRYGHASGLILLDIDYFKRINDEYGHPAGDEVLRQLAEASRGMLREQDLIGRLGGEEFAILLVQPPPDKLHDIAERLRVAIDELVVEHQGERISVTASLGVAETGNGADNLERLIATADERLYTAKREGRNRVCTTEPQSS